MITTSITSSWRRALLALAATALLGTSCQRELDLPDVIVPDGQIVFGSEGLDLSVETKASEVTSLSSFYVSAVTGSAGSESSAWTSTLFSEVPASSPKTYTANKYWPASDPGYKFYGSNVALNFAAGGTYVNASNATDVVCAYLSSPTYNTKNTLSFEHIFARLYRVDVAAQTGYTISNISMYITPKTGGTYNLRTGAGHTDGTGWSSVATGSATLISNKTGATNNDIYMVPGNYQITCSWVSTDPSGASVTHTNEVSTLPIKGGATNNISVVLGGDIVLGVDLQEYCEYDYRDNLDYFTLYSPEAQTIRWTVGIEGSENIESYYTGWISWIMPSLTYDEYIAIINDNIPGRTIQYSKDFGHTWTSINAQVNGAEINVNAGDIIWFTGNNTTYYSQSNELSIGINTFFKFQKPTYAYGNIGSLLSAMDASAFECFFSSNNNLLSFESKPIVLPSSINQSCYRSMFSGCTSLTFAPALPATTLADYCYSYMFSGCTSLRTAPELPVTALADNCYAGMFSGCTSLRTAPELPATTLAGGCYGSMFYGCTSLRTAPELPVTTLAQSCYASMFSGCTSLRTAPDLPATTLTNDCYNAMFRGCTSLRRAPELPATTLTNYCYEYMFRDCASLTSVPELPATTLANYCYDAMFANCTSLTSAPELPATTLARSCYSDMFSGCTSLTSAPALPATTLADYCYSYMFLGCTSLRTAPELPATTLAENCYANMFYGCTSLTSAPKLSATTLANYCYFSMFKGCTSLRTAPELPATTLTSQCYYTMFQGCSSLNYIKALFTTTPSSLYTSNWVSGVAATGTFVKADAATWNVTGTSGVPTGWTVFTESTEPNFSVSSTKKVKFAKGNLQAVIGTGISDYRATASSWNFAEHQYDIIGNAAGNNSFAVGTTVDLFGWVGESASYDSYGLCTNTAYNNAYYGTSGSDALKTDWGSIPGIDIWIGSGWRTLTTTEWNYLFTQRTNASSLYGQCQITTASGTVTGMLILPDNWTKPSNCTVTPGTGAFDRVTYSATATSGTTNAWCDMESAGAVFLPAAGYRLGASVFHVGSYGVYWSSSVYDEYNAYDVYFGSGYLNPQSYDLRYYGFSVRLVKDAN